MDRKARVSIDMSAAEHKKLKMAATLMGLSMRELIMECVREGLSRQMALAPVPNEETLKAFQESDQRKNIRSFRTVDELFEDLGI